jgi:hypothetical protein
LFEDFDAVGISAQKQKGFVKTNQLAGVVKPTPTEGAQLLFEQPWRSAEVTL